MKEKIKKPFFVKLDSLVISPEDAQTLMDKYGLKNRIEVREFIRNYAADEIFAQINIASDYNEEYSEEQDG